MRIEDGTEVAEVLLAKPSRMPRLILAVLALFLASAAGWAHLTKVDLVVAAPGRIRPAGCPQTDLAPVSGEGAASPIGGRIVEARVREGDAVRPGDVLVRVDTTKLDHEIARLDHGIRAETEELACLAELENTLTRQESAALARARQEAAENESAIERERSRGDHAASEVRFATLEREKCSDAVSRTRALVREGLEPAQRLRDADHELREAEARLETAVRARAIHETEVRVAEERWKTSRAAVASLPKDYESRRGELALRRTARSGSIDALRESRMSLEFDRAQSTIRARVGGLVTQGQPRVGDFLEPGKPFLWIAEESGLRIDLTVPASQSGRIRTGMKARVKVDAFDYQEFGAIEGTVTHVSPDVSVVGARAVYVVRVSLEGAELARGDRRGTVRIGMTGQVEILTGTERLSALGFRKVREQIRL